MKILAFDAASSIASVAMVEYSTQKSTVLHHYRHAHERTDSSSFFQGLETTIQCAGKPDLIVVGLGPGSYNGLRVSIAAAQGMASALGIKLIGFSSALAMKEDDSVFSTLSENAPDVSQKKLSGYWIAGDARGRQYWLASVLNHHFLQEPILLPPEKIADFLSTQPDFPLLAYTPLPKIDASQKIQLAHPCAITLAALSQEVECTTALDPLYLKPAHITLPKHS